MKIMARDQGLDSFPANACEVKILAASDRLVRARSLQRFPTISRHFPRFPGISQVPPPLASSAPDVQQSSGRASSAAEPEPHENRTATPCFTLNDPHLGGGGTSLPFSPCGEAKWVRGPSGQGASRAEEKGARRSTCQIASFTPRVRKHEIRLSRNMALTQAALEQRPYHLLGFLGHETRNTNHGLFSRASAVGW